MKPVVMTKTRMPSKKKMKDRLEDPSDGSDYCTKDPEEESDKTAN